MKKIFSNKDIYMYADLLNKTFNESKERIILPIKFNFFLQKNIKKFSDLKDEIENSRIFIGQKYGEYNEKDSSYTIIDKDKILLAQQDLNNLMEIEQKIDVMMITLDDLEDVKLTPQQMQAILFMIDE